MSTFSEHADAIAQAQDDHGETFTWKDSNYLCVASGARVSKPAGAGGVAFDADLSFTCTTDQFSPSTAQSVADEMLNKAITFQGRQYRVDSTKLICSTLLLKVEANDINQR